MARMTSYDPWRTVDVENAERQELIDRGLIDPVNNWEMDRDKCRIRNCAWSDRGNRAAICQYHYDLSLEYARRHGVWPNDHTLAEMKPKVRKKRWWHRQ